MNVIGHTYCNITVNVFKSVKTLCIAVPSLLTLCSNFNMFLCKKTEQGIAKYS
jgi:hypothetical protein